MFYHWFSRFILCGALFVFQQGCVRRASPPPNRLTSEEIAKLKPEQQQELVAETGGNWLYGEGLGATALNVATVVVFPPYLVYVAGNALLDVSGYEPVQISDALPDEQRDTWNSVYSGVASGPGRCAALVSGNEYRDKKVIEERMRKFRVPHMSYAESLELYLQEG